MNRNFPGPTSQNLLLPVLLALSASAPAADSPPTAVISNDLVTARIYLPDSDNGYYRGTRFDWSGVIYSLTHDGHEYFGEWQESDDPYLHDRITGPVDSFGALGYRPGEPGATFVRVGVGVCRQPDEEDFPGTTPTPSSTTALDHRTGGQLDRVRPGCQGRQLGVRVFVLEAADPHPGKRRVGDRPRP